MVEAFHGGHHALVDDVLGGDLPPQQFLDRFSARDTRNQNLTLTLEIIDGV